MQPMRMLPVVSLLALLAAHAGRVLTRDAISSKLRGVAWDGLERTIEVRVSRLRRKLGDDGRIIKSVRGSGYLLIPEV